ncbi:galactose-specific lectin nattectin-like isoform X2 [Mytilus galloprovincialis]|uniref:galactose-specific lectin nattectin-like isoform X2 n=1 Tax=Mytilus galloprovincialis TaxID=29158 RepID=UPI003F7BBDCA
MAMTKSVPLFLLLSACCVLSACPPGWFVGYNSSCYLFHQRLLPWVQASHYCLSLGGHLARIESETEKNLIRDELKHLSGEYWIDGIDDVTESDWRWASTYGKIEPTFWNSGEPNDGYGNEDCMETFNIIRGLWNDDDCSKHQFSICEKEFEE